MNNDIIFEELNMEVFDMLRDTCGKKLKEIWVDKSLYSDLIKNCARYNDGIDPISERNLIMAGYIGCISINKSMKVNYYLPDEVVQILTLPVRSELKVEGQAYPELSLGMVICRDKDQKVLLVARKRDPELDYDGCCSTNKKITSKE